MSQSAHGLSGEDPDWLQTPAIDAQDDPMTATNTSASSIASQAGRKALAPKLYKPSTLYPKLNSNPKWVRPTQSKVAAQKKRKSPVEDSESSSGPDEIPHRDPNLLPLETLEPRKTGSSDPSQLRIMLFKDLMHALKHECKKQVELVSWKFNFDLTDVKEDHAQDLKTTQKEICNLRDSLDQTEADTSLLGQQLQDAQKKIERLQQEKTQMSEAVDILCRECSKQEQQILDQSQEILKLGSNAVAMSKLQAQIDGLTQRLNNRDELVSGRTYNTSDRIGSVQRDEAVHTSKRPRHNSPRSHAVMPGDVISGQAVQDGSHTAPTDLGSEPLEGCNDVKKPRSLPITSKQAGSGFKVLLSESSNPGERARLIRAEGERQIANWGSQMLGRH